MSNLRQQTIDTYNKSAKQLAEYFRGIGSRDKYIKLAIKIAGNPSSPNVLEIGCGDGRDAKMIMAHTPSYQGFDISKNLIELAREYVPDGEFEVADAVTYPYPTDGSIDIIFAFASLLHLTKEEVQAVFEKSSHALRPGGVFYLSVKYSPHYLSKVKEDKFGTRVFYLYSPQLMTELAGPAYQVAHQDLEMIGDTEWLEMALIKK